MADLGMWAPVHTAELLQRYPNKDFIVLASPPCQHYSVANTTSKRPLQQRLQEADRLVQAAIDIFASLGKRGLAMLLENPGTGKLRARKVGRGTGHGREAHAFLTDV